MKDMKKRNFTTVLMLTLALAASAQVNIRIDIKQSKDNKAYDSIYVKSEAKLQTKKTLAAPYSSSVTLQDKESLKPGMYEIFGDSTFMAVILIPDEKNQKFQLEFDGEELTFLNSKENTEYYNYLNGITA